MNSDLVARSLLASVIVGSCCTAHAELLIAKGAKATLTADDEYSAIGKSGTAAKGGTLQVNWRFVPQP